MPPALLSTAGLYRCAGFGSSLVPRQAPVGLAEGVTADADLVCSSFVDHARVVSDHCSVATAMSRRKWLGRAVKEIVDSRSTDMPEVMDATRPHRICREAQAKC